MIRSCSSLVLAAVIQVTFVRGDQSYFASEPRRDVHDIDLYNPYQEMIPRHCWAPPRGINIYRCCPIPELYTKKVMKSCGIKRKSADDSRITIKPKRPTNRQCKEFICLMTNAKLMRANKTVAYEKLRTYIDHWADMNPEFSEAILAAKKICAKAPAFDFIGPAGCEEGRIFFCLTTNILWNCKLREYDDCQLLRDHIDECKPYYAKPKDQEEINHY